MQAALKAQSPMARREIHPQGLRSKHLLEMSDVHIEAMALKRGRDDKVCNQQHPLPGELSAATLSEDPASAFRWCCGRKMPRMKVRILPFASGHSLQDPSLAQLAEPCEQPSSSDTQQPELQQALSDLPGAFHPSSAQSLQKDAVSCEQGSRCLMLSSRRTAAETHFGCIALGLMEGASVRNNNALVDAQQLFPPSS